MEHEKPHRTMCLCLAAVLTLSLPGCAAQKVQTPEEQKATATGPSLYERVGGINTIAMLADDLIDRSYEDPVLNANPRLAEAHRRFPKPIYKYQATTLACMAWGGPCKYTGRSVKEAHQHLQITEKEWQAMVKLLHESMDRFAVPPREQAEIVAGLESSKGDVVTSPPRSASK